ncbi:LOW QUALITY PROTEIN: Hypothetical protein PHPALM_9409 [Phytophthora palmivora]|uniref:Integrase zinc-binding domain-containing protein n=1 Tax=Phytophthora palmivora TaxID=4796 RepID=A0A2P4Y7C7_9STRA|nr:LOW QUALITY PROTEIN: Hypothetical protein PHPALM_9409 [Phytophthora palmivora]
MTQQLTDIVEAQAKSRLVQQMIETGTHRGKKVDITFGLAVVELPNGRGIILPPMLWVTVFKECHDSVSAGHLRAAHTYCNGVTREVTLFVCTTQGLPLLRSVASGPLIELNPPFDSLSRTSSSDAKLRQSRCTYARIAQTYWWPNLQHEVKRWVLSCQECGSRKARPREVVPPLRSMHGGDVGDRWALDVAGPLPTTDDGERFVIAAVEYVTSCGDGKTLVERFHRTWKDCVATYMSDEYQRGWDVWIDFAVYAYNSGRHSTVMLSPNELMMGRRLRSPNQLMRSTSVGEAGEMTVYHKRLLAAMKSSHRCAEIARDREQHRQARYYNRRVKNGRGFKPGDRVWMFKPPRGSNASKFVHQWLGPLKVIESAGYDNYLLEREDDGDKHEQFIAHVSFLVTYHYPTTLLDVAATDIEKQLEHESTVEWETNDATTREIV